jgi:alanine or glycine:cation symporter, AGCS family
VTKRFPQTATPRGPEKQIFSNRNCHLNQNQSFFAANQTAPALAWQQSNRHMEAFREFADGIEQSLEPLNRLLETWVGHVWGMPLVVVLVGTGLAFSFILGGIQLRGFIHGFHVIRGKYSNPNDPGEITHFQALCTALAATVGLGNIAGVAVAIHVGGPGATFWMIVTGIVGMATKYAECSLAVMYRRVDEKGVVHGGPMHYIELGLGKAYRPLAIFFAVAIIVSSFGAANMFQTNQVASIFQASFDVPPLLTGLVLAVLAGIVLIGGIKRIARVTSRLVPVMGLIYVGGAILVIMLNIGVVPGIVYQIVHDAFTGTAAAGGFAGAVVREVLVTGVRRACFSNEAGLGSAAIAHSAAATKEPIREGVVALWEPFIDTVVICTMTALVILISGAWTAEAKGDILGVTLTALAFDSVLPGFGTYFVPVAVFLFAYSTLLSWSYYGERAVDYLVGEKGILAYKLLFCTLAVVGAVWGFGAVLNFSDLMLGLLVVPNLIAVWLLLPKLRAATQSYFKRLKAGEFERIKRSE